MYIDSKILLALSPPGGVPFTHERGACGIYIAYTGISEGIISCISIVEISKGGEIVTYHQPCSKNLSFPHIMV